MKTAILDVTKTVLDNGLTLIVLESHLMPIVTSTIWYHVGSAHEPPGQTGISHFLEHLMFKGTPTYPKGRIDLLTATHGGHNNAGTIYDYTMYYFTFSADRWELALDIEADRMSHCLFAPEEVEAERQVVLEELSQQNDSPWGLLGMQLEATLFPAAHPYHHSPIGFEEDVEQISRDMIMDYYQAYYVPNNATIVIVGDVRTPEVIQKVQQRFEALSARSLPPPPKIWNVAHQGEQRFELVQETTVKRVEMGYPTAPLTHQDNYALDVIDHLLSHGKTSRLYRRFVEQDQLVTFADTYNHPRKFDGVFHIFAELRPEIQPETFEHVLNEELDRLRHEPVSADELQKVKNVLAVDSVFDQETTAGLAQALGEYEVMDTYAYLNTYIEQIQQVTPDAIQRVAQTYFAEANRTIGWSFPEHPEQAALVLEETDTTPQTEMVFHRLDAEPERPAVPSNLNVTLPTGTCFPFAWTQMFSQPPHKGSFSRWVLENGLIVLFLENHNLPIVAMEAFVNTGQMNEPEDRAGVSVLTGRLLEEGTRRRSAQEIALAIESVGGSLHAKSHGASAQVLSQDSTLAFDLLADILMFPVFDQQIFERERGRMLAMLESDEDNPSLVAYNLFHEMVYGTHPYHRPRKGYRHTVQALTRADIVDYYTTYFVPNNTILAIVGDLSADEVLTQVRQAFGAWPQQPLATRREFTIPRPTGCIRKQVSREKEQAHVYLGHPGITRMNPDFYALLTMDHILGTGSGFTDRISRTLRDEQGLAYTVYAHAALSAEVEPGTFMAYIGTSPEHVERAIAGFLTEIRKIRTEPVTPEELEIAKNYLTGSYLFYFETSSQLAQYLIHTERFQLGEDFLLKYPEFINSVTIQDIMRVAQQYLDPENYYVAVVGATPE